ncbi:MAG: Oligopeptide-binding protein OppA [Chlamydiae bacterium]|nr:Oligopeptide-binding protein OppA [Chlamydiota bacterium]
MAPKLQDSPFCSLLSFANRVIEKFPEIFDERLSKGVLRLEANASTQFGVGRSFSHLRTILLTQFFLQRRMEHQLKTQPQQNKNIFLKLFRTSAKICVALTISPSSDFSHKKISQALRSFVPGIHLIPRSSFLWLHPDLPYGFYYLEVHKLRGREVLVHELKKIEQALHTELLAAHPLSPAIFWPYNEEEAIRQIQLLQKEINTPADLPHISVTFREQTPATLEFLVHLVRPQKHKTLAETLEELPLSLDLFFHHYYVTNTTLPIEIGIFSVKIASDLFNTRDSINLLYARRAVLQYLEVALGPGRDFNGGLFAKLQDHFEEIRTQFHKSVPLFDVFAEKLFYALYPVEARLFLSLEEFEKLLVHFSDLMQDRQPFSVSRYGEDVMIIKATNPLDLSQVSRLAAEDHETVCHAQLSMGDSYYFFVKGHHISRLLKHLKGSTSSRGSSLKLVFQEGAPLSLNPYQSSSDMRCRIVSKLLFEGLIRLDERQNPVLAGAAESHLSSDKRVYTFTLRPHRWSNGERVTATDYVSSWQNALTQYMSHPEFLYMIQNGKEVAKRSVDPSELGVEAIDSKTLKITLDCPDPSFLHKLAQPFFSPLFGSMHEPKWFNGPYVVSEQDSDHLLLEKNPYYWDPKSISLDKIEIRWYEEIESIYTLFREKRVDWIGDPISPLTPKIVQDLDKEGLLHKQEVDRSFLLYFNTKTPPLSSRSIREALSLSINRQAICKAIYPFTTPADLPLAKEKAKVLFQKGLKELGIERESFPTLRFSYSHQTGRKELALLLKKSWEEVLGISVEIERIEWNLFRNQIEKGEFQVTGTIAEMEESPSLSFLKRFEGESSWNFSRWTHEEFHHLLESAAKEAEPEEQIEEALNLLEEEIPFTSLFHLTHLFGHIPELTGYRLDSEGCVDFSRCFFYPT